MKYKLKVTIVGADAGTIFEYKESHGMNGIELVEGKTLGFLLDLIKIVGIDNEEYFEKIEEKELIDFSKFIGRDGRDLVIKGSGDNILKSFDLTGNLFYGIRSLDHNDKINYIETDLSKLVKGDIYVCVSDVEDNDLQIRLFEYFVGENKHNDEYISLYLSQVENFEYIDSSINYSNKRVYKFLRE